MREISAVVDICLNGRENISFISEHFWLFMFNIHKEILPYQIMTIRYQHPACTLSPVSYTLTRVSFYTHVFFWRRIQVAVRYVV